MFGFGGGGSNNKSYTLELMHGGKKAGKLENLAGTLSVQEVSMLVKQKLGLSEDHTVRLMVTGGRELGKSGQILSELKLKAGGTTKVLVISSVPKTVPVAAPVVASAAPSSVVRDAGKDFDDVEKNLAEAEDRYREFLDQGYGSVEEGKSKLLWFNCVVNMMTKLDTLKDTSRAEYDRNERGRALIKRCNVLLDRVEQKRLELK